MSSSSIRTVPGPDSSVHLSFAPKLSLLYTLPQTQASSSHAAHSLRQASVRRLQDCTRRCGGNGALGGILGSPNRRAVRRHAPRSLRRSSARRVRKGTGLLGSCGVVGEVRVQLRLPLPEIGVSPEVARASSIVPVLAAVSPEIAGASSVVPERRKGTGGVVSACAHRSWQSLLAELLASWPASLGMCVSAPAGQG